MRAHTHTHIDMYARAKESSFYGLSLMVTLHIGIHIRVHMYITSLSFGCVGVGVCVLGKFSTRGSAHQE